MNSAITSATTSAITSVITSALTSATTSAITSAIEFCLWRMSQIIYDNTICVGEGIITTTY